MDNAVAGPLPILLEGDPRLRLPSCAVSGVDAGIRSFLDRIAATLTEFRARHGFGRAISAPQVGIGKRMIAADLGAGPFFLLNPEVVWRSDETFEVWDDCFSVPDRLARVVRNRSISLTYRDDLFRERRWDRLPPDLAELLLHEIDHLDGILMTDRAAGPDAIRPAADRALLVDGARPAHRLSLASIAASARHIAPVFLSSPQFESGALSDRLGARVTLKIETLNPVRSFKGRGADWFVGARVARGDRTPMVCASAGNFGQALAWACRARGLPLTVFAAVNANALKVERMRALGADVRLEGDDFDAAKERAAAFAAETGSAMIEDGLEPEITEGAGSLAVELFSRGDVFDDVVVPLGDGALLNGIARWTKAASPATRTVGVVASGAPAVAESWRRPRGSPVVVHPSTDTIADGIAVRIPIAEAVDDMYGLVDETLEVSDERILDAMRLLHRHEGLVVEPAGAAGLAALLAARERFAGRSVAVVVTGGNVTAEGMRAWLGPE